MLWAFPVLSFTLQTLLFHGAQSLECKCAPSEACWPSDNTWASLNASVDGRLIRTTLPAAVCYPSEPSYNAEQCEQVIQQWSTTPFHSSDPTSIHNPTSANNSCNPIYPNGTSTAGDPLAGSRGCNLGMYPPFVVNATEITHVQEAVRFAKKMNLRLSVKNTGHSGKTAMFGSLSIWTHHMKSVEYHDDFQPTCSNSTVKRCQSASTSASESDAASGPQKSFTVGAGLQDEEIFHVAAKYGMAVVGGTNSDVGLVGWATGGGHGYLTSEFGMGADNIIQAVIVTADGDALTVNECQNSDLFWAIRGGGGGTWGVITELTVKAHPMPQATTLVLNIQKTTNCTSCWWDLMAELHAQLPELKREGVTGYYSIDGPPSYSSINFYGVFFLYNKPNGTMETLFEPLLSTLQNANASAKTTSQIAWAPTWISVFDTLPSAGSAGKGGGASASRLLPASSFTQDKKELARVLELMGVSDEISKAGVSNPSIAGSMSASTAPVDNSLNPAWRNTVVHFIVKESWKDSLPSTQVEAALDEMTNVKGAALHALAPDAGAYFNEADTYEPDWQQSFWGANYEKLVAIKQKYDPEDLFWCRHCVGSEGWAQQLDGVLCRIRE